MRTGLLSHDREALYAKLDAIRLSLGFSPDQPVDPFLMAARLHCQVGVHEIQGQVGGMLILDSQPNGDPKPPLILLNRRLPRQSRRFSLAHELVHLLLHPVPADSSAEMREIWMEQQANDGAAELLMPHRGVCRILEGFSHIGENAEQLMAFAFDVSRTQARYRLRTLFPNGLPGCGQSLRQGRGLGEVCCQNTEVLSVL